MKALRTTTALVAGLAALVPTTVPAQQSTQEGIDTALTACIASQMAEGVSQAEAEANCVTTEVDTAEPAPGGAPAPGGEAAPGGEPAPGGEAATTEAASEAGAAPVEAEPAPAEAQAETPAEEIPTPPVAEAEFQTPPAEEQPPAEAEAAAEPEPEVASPAEPQASPAPATETATETVTEEPPPAGVAEEAPPAEAPAEATEIAPVELSPEAEEAAAALAAALEEAPAEEGAPVENEALMSDPDTATPEAEASAEAQVVEEVITEDTARSSDEDFETTVSGQAAAPAASPKKESGLSDAEKLAILGLGAIAVGALLKDGREVAVNSGDRVVVQNPDGSYQVIKDDNALLRQPGSTIRTQSYADGSTRTITTKPDGAQIVTIYDAQRRIVQRTRIEPDGTRYVLVDDSVGAEPVEVSTLPQVTTSVDATDADALRAALAAQNAIDRRFTLAQVRQIPSVRALAPAISVETITFETGSAAIRPDQARSLATLGNAIRNRIAENPREIFLIEGHTDAVGNAAYNLALSDRRAELLALALTEYFDVPPENLVVQGYGEQFLKVDTQAANEANRRASVRRITELLQVATSN